MSHGADEGLMNRSDMTCVSDFPSSYVVDVEPDWPDRDEEVIKFHAHYEKLITHTGEFRDVRF
jgi:hypothetical protein